MNYRELMRSAYFAAKESPDPSSQNGAVLLPDGHANFVRWWNEIHPAFWLSDKVSANYEDRDFKLRHVTHAEQAAIFAAGRSGLSTYGATLVCPWAACVVCARSIIEAGVGRLVVHKQRMECSSVWDDQIKEAFGYLRKARVEVIWLDHNYNDEDLSILVSGKAWNP